MIELLYYGVNFLNKKTVNSAVSGDKKALQKLYSEYSGRVYALCYQYLKNSADAEDVTQETFIRVINNISNLKDVEKFDSWLFSVAKNCCKEFLRKNKNVVLKSENSQEFFSQLTDENNMFNPEQRVIDDEKAETLQNILENIPKEQQQAVILYYFEEKSIKEIANLTGCTEHCIRGRIKLGKKRILKQMKMLEHKDKLAYMGAFSAFGNLVKPVSAKISTFSIGAILGKATAAVLSITVAGFGIFGLHNLYKLSEKQEKTEQQAVENTKTFITDFFDPDGRYDLSLFTSVPNNWISEEPEDLFFDYSNIDRCRFFLTEYDEQYGMLGSYYFRVNCSIYIGVFDSKCDIITAQKEFEEYLYEKYYIDESDSIYDDFKFRSNVDFETESEQLAVSYNKGKSWKYGINDTRSTYFAIKDCGVPVESQNARYFVLLEADFKNGNLDKKAFSRIVDSLKIEQKPYSIEMNKKGLYNYTVKNRQGSVIFQSKTPVLSEPKFDYVNNDILKSSIQSGTGIATCETTYFDVETGKVSEAFYSVLGEYKDKVLFVDYDNGQFKIAVQNFFNKDTFYKATVLDNVYVAADPVVDCKISDEGTAEITYLKGTDYKETKILIDLK